MTGHCVRRAWTGYQLALVSFCFPAMPNSLGLGYYSVSRSWD